ncbi:phosphodiesterase [Thalassospira sp.]|uniref:phosphodiesterase n=1 Tax=Thalassospira sp. TaxID=1912094 RepID=UPI0027349A81|nr:phosphodiesterase [Thalassospira sp.]MDP2696735.1 phosphodiesterase [Thalassospira sp.]
MKFIHLSDTHLRARDDFSRLPHPGETLRAVIDEINAYHADAEICVLTGDLTHHGRPDQYDHIAGLLSTLTMPVIAIPGNHDVRGPMIDAFPDTPVDENGFINFGRTVGGIRFVMLDSVVPGTHHGTLCPARLDWLSRELDHYRDLPTFLFMHHPPLEMGLPFLDSIRMESDVALAHILKDHPQVKYMFFGHLHRPCTGVWQGIPFAVGGSSHKGEPFDMRHEKEEELVERAPLKPMFGIVLTDDLGNVRYHYDMVQGT